MDHGKALLLIEKNCYIRCLNFIYGNNFSETLKLDCVAAKRLLPCSLCFPRSALTLEFPPSPLPLGTPSLVAFKIPVSAAVISTKPLLTRKERAYAEAQLVKFGEIVRVVETPNDLHGYRPRSSYFPVPIITSILDNLTTITTGSILRVVIPTWVFINSHHEMALLALVLRLNTKVSADRDAARAERNEKNRAKALAKRTAAKASDSEGPTPVTVKRSKRPALDTVTNRPAKRAAKSTAPRAPVPSVADVARSFRPQYQTRTDRTRLTASAIADENAGQVGLRRSGRLSNPVPK
jgi:hypothetical protein